MRALAWFRSVFATFVAFPLSTLLHSLAVLVVVFILKSAPLANAIARSWGRSTCFLFGVRVHLKGQHNVPSGGAMFLFNHTSFFDIFTICSVFPELRFGAKIELFQIPIFGAAMRALGTLPIARSNRQSAIRVLEEAQQRARRGEKFILSPEGGRNTEEKLLPFKAGPFIFSIQSGIPLVPVVIRGAMQVWPKGVLIPATRQFFYDVTLAVLQPIPTSGKTVDQRSHLQALVRKEMEVEMQS